MLSFLQNIDTFLIDMAVTSAVGLSALSLSIGVARNERVRRRRFGETPGGTSIIFAMVLEIAVFGFMLFRLFDC